MRGVNGAEVDPLVLVVQLKKEADDARRRAARVEEELQRQLSAAHAAARLDQQRLALETEEERARRTEAEEAAAAERRRRKEEAERHRAKEAARDADMEETRARLEGEIEESRAKLAAAQEAMRQEQANRAAREAVAERKFAALQHKLQVAQSSCDEARAGATKAQIEFRKELDEAHLRHSDACQQLVESEQVRARLVDDNARLVEELEAAVASGEQCRARLRAEFEARLSAERDHAEEERAEGEEEERRRGRTQVKKVEAEYRARLDEAKQRLTSILRHKKAKYETRRGELQAQVDGLRKRLQRSEAETEDLRQRLARLLGRASGLIENHCSTTKRLMVDGRESVASFYTGPGPMDEEHASLASESWSLPNGPRTETPVPELNL